MKIKYLLFAIHALRRGQESFPQSDRIDSNYFHSVTMVLNYIDKEIQQNKPSSAIYNDLLSKDISAEVAQLILDSLLVRDDSSFLYHMHSKVFSDLQRTVDCSIRQKRFPKGRKESVDAEEYAQMMLWVTQHAKQLFAAWERLWDFQSRSLFVDLLRFQISGAQHVQLPVDSSTTWSRHNQFVANMRIDLPLQQQFPQFSSGSFRCWLFPFQGRMVRFLGFLVPLFHSFAMDQYFFVRDGFRIVPEEGDYVIDAGGFVGESALRFSWAVGPQGKVYSFEPVQQHVDLIRLNARNNDIANITIIPYGLYDREHDAGLLSINTINSSFSADEDDNNLPLIMLDTLSNNGTIERVDFIKMDIEGAELAALKGAEQTIRRFRPKLAISVYHSNNRDLYAVS
ncbi:FkbM family methyltransferase, partial [Candidatus Magnetaquicoccus inordinatus]|uniref:FkbM family methyltransferase n=1 Tax=Candidatus Magnetaquicoccus inordinatus TaxID=2496818 RepID=UPI00102B401C